MKRKFSTDFRKAETNNGRRNESTREKELTKFQRKKSEVDRLFAKFYEDNAFGRLDNGNYEMLREKYHVEQMQLTKQIEQYTAKLNETKDNEENVRK